MSICHVNTKKKTFQQKNTLGDKNAFCGLNQFNDVPEQSITKASCQNTGDFNKHLTGKETTQHLVQHCVLKAFSAAL